MGIDLLWRDKRWWYPVAFGVALWGGWLLYTLVIADNFRVHRFVSSDYMAFYSAAVILQEAGDTADLYDIGYQHGVQQELVGFENEIIYLFIMPPFVAAAFRPLAQLPYLVSLVTWLGLGLVLYGVALRQFTIAWWRPFLWSFVWFPFFNVITFGQTTFFSIFVFAMVYRLWVGERYFWAGGVASLLLFKPPLVVGLGLLWLAGWRREWPAMVGGVVGSAVLVGGTAWFYPTALWEYVEFTRNTVVRFSETVQFPDWHRQTIRGFWSLLLPEYGTAATVLWVVCGLVGVGAFFWLYGRYRNDRPVLYALAICVMVWVSPHVLIYDVTLLVIPVVLLWEVVGERRPEQRREYRPVFVTVLFVGWLVYLVSSGVTKVQIENWPFAVLPSALFFVGGMYWIWVRLDYRVKAGGVVWDADDADLR